MQSFYNFEQYHGQFKGDFVEFVKDDKNGISAWVDHTRSWLTEPALDLHLVTYEGLRSNTNRELLTLFQNIGMNVENEILNKAIELSTLNIMKLSESEYTKHNPGYKYKFIKEGKIEPTINQEAKSIISESTLGIYEEILHLKYNRDFTLK